MAAEERSKTEFSEILGKIGRKFEIIHMKWTDDKFFEIKFRTEIDRDSEDFNALCDEWSEAFSKVTNTVWVKKISNTGPKIRFRKQYQCWTLGGIVQKELLFDSRRCKATLDMKVLTDNPFTRRKNKHIRLGLNVVVKINFMHLHPVDITKNFAFFVHVCDPQPEAPKPVIQPNNRLPQLIAEIVQKNSAPKGLNSTHPRVSKDNHKQLNNNLDKDTPDIYEAHLLQEFDDKPHIHDNSQHDVLKSNLGHQSHLIQNASTLQLPSISQAIHLVQNVPLQAMDTVKLELAPHLQQYTQVMVSDVSEPLLMCQPLMFDTSQVIPVSTHTLSSHFVQIHSPNLNQ